MIADEETNGENDEENSKQVVETEKENEIFDSGWKRQTSIPSLPETFNTVSITANFETAPFWKKLGSFSGIGFLVAVGYMDPGNWASDVVGGSQFGYDLLCIILMSSLCAMVLQYLCVKLGVATERDLAQACRDSFHPIVVVCLWVIFEIAMIATDIAELLGAAIALFFLLGIPLPAGVVILGVDVILILLLQQNRLRLLEAFVMMLTFLILCCLTYVVTISQPNWNVVFQGYIPTGNVITNPDELFIAISILGATVMPHNLFLHSAVIQSRRYPRSTSGKKFAIRWGSIDCNLSLTVAFAINSLLLISAATAFHQRFPDTEDIFMAFERFPVVFGSKTPAILFAIALLASGQQASLTGTLTGQIVMEGMLDMKINPWKRRFVTRMIAIVPVVIITIIMGEKSIILLLVSQVILSLTLSFAIFPLVYFTSNTKKMGKDYVNGWCLTLIAIVIIFVIAGLNVYLLCTPSTWDFSR